MSEESPLRLGLPKGRMHDGVVDLLQDAGIHIRRAERAYRPKLSVDGLAVKILKPQNVVEMLHAGSRDLGFAGADWAAELEADVVQVLDTELDPVRLVAAAPAALLGPGDTIPSRRLVVAGEYERLTRGWIARRGLDAVFVRSYGATEVFPPEDADCIVDVAATGATLEANGLRIVDEVLRSSTRLFAARRAMDDPSKRDRIEGLAMVLGSVLEARRRVMLEVNVPAGHLDALVGILPCMRRPTVSRLHGEDGYAVKAAVPREQLPGLIPRLKAGGGSDIVITPLAQVVP
jgi:ATP phosphoribosyltransferase